MRVTLDAAAIRRSFDSTTFARGRTYAATGAVLTYRYDSDDDAVVGDVQGRARAAYEVVATFRRARTGGLTGIDGECTCPMGHNCKHVAALLLAFTGGGGDLGGEAVAAARPAPTNGNIVPISARAARRAPSPARRTTAWEKPLEALIAGLEHRGERSEPEMALQFEVVSPRPGGPKLVHNPRVRLRPALRGARDNWIRSGISWSNLDYYGYGRNGVTAERKELLRELLALNRLSARYGHYHYSSYSTDPAVWLEDFASRRVWDLLGQAQELDVPLVLGDGRNGHVRLLRAPAVVGADVVAVGADLRVTPCVHADGEQVAPGPMVLIGEPAHGLAWWGPTPAGSLHLSLGPFVGPLGAGERSLLRSEAVDVPARHRERFVQELYPRLARSVTVVSSDGSVDLPEVPPGVLVLRVRHDGLRSLVRWQRGIRGSDARGELWGSPSGGEQADVDAAIDAVTEVVRDMPAMVERSWAGERLAPVCEFTGMDAVRLVADTLPALAGVAGLLIEEEGERPAYHEAIAAPVVSLRPAGRRAHDGDWFDLSIEVRVDGEQVVFQELFVALAEGESHLVLPSGTYFALDRPELKELADLIVEARAMQDSEPAAVDRIRVSRFQAGFWEDLHRLGVVTEQAAAWEAAVQALAEATDESPAPAPAAMEATLRPYQLTGFNWLAFLYRHRLGGILADDMGLGKTLQALSLVCHVRAELGVEQPFLVVAPTSVVGNWAEECRRFAPELAVATVAETEARRWVSLHDLADKADVVVTSYTLFRLEYEDYERIAWAGVFFDEAQFVKNPRAIAHQRAKALPAPFKVAMTGTPMENNLRELWALLTIAAPGLFPRADRFTEHYGVPIERHGDLERLAQLRRRIRPLMLRRKKEQVESELPAKQEQVLELELAPKHRRLYQTHLQRERQKVLGLLGDMQRNRFEILRSLTVLRQAALDIALVDERCGTVPSTKLDALADMLGEVVADGHRVLVFSQFTRFLRSAAARASAVGVEYCYLDGRTRQRDKVIARFRTGDVPVFFISLKAGGFGLTLTEADYCVLLDPWWNPATEAQAVDRAHRIGQSRKVMVYRLVAKDTIEEKVMALKAKKAALFASVMDAGGFENAALSAADIRALLE